MGLILTDASLLEDVIKHRRGVEKEQKRKTVS